jgi:hypothetical protein
MQQLARTDPLGPDFEEPAEEIPMGRGQRVRKPSAYIQALQSGTGRTSNRQSDPGVPRGMRIPEVPKTVEEHSADPENMAARAELTEDWEMVDIFEHGMAAATADSEALEPMFEEAKKRPDWAHTGGKRVRTCHNGNLLALAPSSLHLRPTLDRS